jgi:Mlc titration factor MtfA (ptsG expression regulator)
VVGVQAGIKDAFEKQFTAAKAVFKTAPITWYAKSDPPKEFFAEAFALFHADPEWMHTNLPHMFDWFQTLSITGKPHPPP